VFDVQWQRQKVGRRIRKTTPYIYPPERTSYPFL
jgi:hypothetical protein